MAAGVYLCTDALCRNIAVKLATMSWENTYLSVHLMTGDMPLTKQALSGLDWLSGGSQSSHEEDLGVLGDSAVRITKSPLTDIGATCCIAAVALH